MTSTSNLRKLILQTLSEHGLTDTCYSKSLDYVIQLFNAKGLGDDYYGYHNINHELSVTYIALLAAKGSDFKNFLKKTDIKRLYFSALLHDFNPQKNIDKPQEEEVIEYLKKDKKLLGWIKEAGIDVEVVSMLILRTAYPWAGPMIHSLEKKLNHFFSKSKFSKKPKLKKHFSELGRYLSVSDRVGAYALGSFLDALEMVKKNAHSLGWDPETMIKRSILYFEDLFNRDEDLTDSILRSLPVSMRRTFMKNVEQIYQLRGIEHQIRSSIVYDRLQLVPTLENNNHTKYQKKLHQIFEELPDPLQFRKNNFFELLHHPKTILITLRKQHDRGEIIGYARGGPIQHYLLSSEIKDKKVTQNQTVFLEPVAIKMGYWGQGGSDLMRLSFRKEAKNQGYKFLASYEHREIIHKRIIKKEKIEFLQKFNPERLDFFRIRL